MKIVKCKNKNCLCNTHVFTSAGKNVKCFSCGGLVNVAEAIDDVYKQPYLFLCDKLTNADNLIAVGDFDGARVVIAEVLEIAPGPSVGDLPNTGEVYWRKLLVDVGCKNDMDLLSNGKLLDRYPSFINAVKYANDDEKHIYTSVENKKRENFIKIKNFLEKRVINDKINTKAEKLLSMYKNEFDLLQKQAIVHIANLEAKEEELRENVIDCGIVSGEYKSSVGDVFSAMIALSHIFHGLTNEEKDLYLKRMDKYCSLSNEEANNQRRLATTDVYYLKYSKLLEEQKELTLIIRKDISNINSLREKIVNTLKQIDSITQVYAYATSALENGNYDPAKKILRP